jgi:hypothetical protein
MKHASLPLQALRGVFETGLHVNSVDPEVDLAFG